MIAVLRRNRVYSLFKEYFGEDRVDMQNNSIIVWWPEVLISNEYNESHTIKNLYAKLSVDNHGSLIGRFQLNRTEYTYSEWVSGYKHSHVPRISYYEDGCKYWEDPCLGSGPIRETCCQLNLGYDEDVWRLFIFELDQYVGHESVEGVPYIRINTIGVEQTPVSYTEWHIPRVNVILPNTYDRELLKAIVQGLSKAIIVQKPFRFNWIDGCYGIADSPLNIVLKVSNIFIDWYNNLPSSEQSVISAYISHESLPKVIRKCKIVNNTIFRKINSGVHSSVNLIGTKILLFKGEDKFLDITNLPGEEEEPQENFFNILDPRLVMYIIHRILRTINYRFNGKDKERASRTTEAVRYI